MQCRARDRAAADKHRFEYGHRRENPRPADLNLDIEQLRFDTLGGVFISDRPPRRFRSEAESLALLERVDLDYRAVSLVGKITSNLIEVTNGIQNLVN